MPVGEGKAPWCARGLWDIKEVKGRTSQFIAEPFADLTAKLSIPQRRALYLFLRCYVPAMGT